MLSPYPATFGDHRDCSGGDIFLLVEGQDSTCFRLNPPLLFISEAHGMKAHSLSTGKCDPGRTLPG